MTEIITVGEKGQIVIPKKIRNDFNIQKGTKLIIKEEGEKVILKPSETPSHSRAVGLHLKV